MKIQNKQIGIQTFWKVLQSSILKNAGRKVVVGGKGKEVSCQDRE